MEKKKMEDASDFIMQMQFESTFEYESTRRWIQDNTLYLLSTIVIYLSVVAIIRSFMSSRKPLNLTTPLLLWNVSLSVFSFLGAIRVTQEFIATYQRKGGLHGTICYANKSNGAFALWSYLFTMSKVVELIDTLFIVLRKSPLIFLHWYHHAVTLAFGVIASSSDLSLGRWIMVMNFTVHFFMYGYYALKQLKVSIPRTLAMAITAMQLSQMAIGVTVFTYAYLINRGMSDTGNTSTLPCETCPTTIVTGLAMYFSYLILFVRFFAQTYFKKKKISDSVRSAHATGEKSVTMSHDVNDNVAMSKKVD